MFTARCELNLVIYCRLIFVFNTFISFVPSTYSFCKLCIAFRFCDQHFVTKSRLLHSCYIPRQSIRYSGFVVITGEKIGFNTPLFCLSFAICNRCLQGQTLLPARCLEFSRNERGPRPGVTILGHEQCAALFLYRVNLLWLVRCALATLKTDSE